MRRSSVLLTLCLIFLLVPIYLWKVQGWWSDAGIGLDDSTKPLDLNDSSRKFDPLDASDFYRGILAGAFIAKNAAVDPIELLAETDVVELLRQSLLRYRQNVRGYACTLCKHERINGKLNDPETIEVWFLEAPFSVMMHWKEGGGPACASLYVKHQHDNKILVRPKLAKQLIGYVERTPDHADVKPYTRYLVTEFGLRCGTERTYRAWKGVRDSGSAFQVSYLGLQKNVPEAGGRDCHVIRRQCNPPEEDGLTEITIYIDSETWLQVGSVLKANGELIGSYWFKDIKLNPDFEPKQFTSENLKKF